MIPKLVIFDCDGVLVDSEPTTFAVITQNLRARGLDLLPDDMERLFLGGTMQGVGETAGRMGARIEQDWLANIYSVIHGQLAKGTPLITGIESVLDALDRHRICYSVGSNGSMEKMQITLGQHPNLWARLDGRIYSGQTHTKPKPAPDLYLYAAAAANIDPSQCVVVDDSPAGCRGATSAGIRCLGFAAASDGASLAAAGAEPFYDMADLPELLGLK